MAEPVLADRPRLAALTIENFRGVRDPMSFDLNASAVLLWGPNGTGKTTLFDALLWLCRGDIPRLHAYTLRRNEDYVTNRYRASQPAVVSAEFVNQGRIVTVTRRGDSRDNYLEFEDAFGRVTGDAAATSLRLLLVGGHLSLAEVLRTSGLLQQDDLRLLLRDKPDQRYRQLLRLLGLEVLEAFERQARAWHGDAREAARAALVTLQQRQRSSSSIEEEAETLRVQLAQADRDLRPLEVLYAAIENARDLVAVDPRPENPEALAALSVAVQETSTRLRSTLQDLEALPPSPPGPAGDEAELVSRLSEATGALQRAAAVMEAAEHARRQMQSAQDSLNALAALAIPLLQSAYVDGELTPCPVCQTAIDAQAVIAGLQNRAAEGSAIAAADTALAEAQDAAAQARHVRDRVAAELAAAQTAREQREAAEQFAARIVAAFDGLTRGQAIRLISPKATAPRKPAASAAALEWLIEHRDGILADLRRASTRLDDLSAASVTSSSMLRAARAAAQRASNLPKIEAQLETLRAQVAEAQRAHTAAQRAETLAKSIVDGATAAITDIFRERFASLEPLMNDIYARLDPHPAFTRLDFRVETYRARGTATASVTDEATDTSANPLLIFSSAQANIVVLAAFLALGWAAGPDGLPFVLMDDPLQALDDVNVLGFADLARHLRRHRQLVLATHEERFARVLERKLMGRQDHEDLLIHRFVGWSREGPTVETRRVVGRSVAALRVVAS
jgi:DNA repair exonuclease SbcCD ATPase subunit